MAGGYGNSPWGSNYGGAPLESGGSNPEPESIPASDTWDTFDLSGVRQPNDLERVQVFVEVETIGNGNQFFASSFNVVSGGLYPDNTALFFVDKAVTEDFTAEYRVTFNSLPPDFSNVVAEHAYIGLWSQQDFAVGLFFSQVGVQFTGEIELDGGNDIIEPPEHDTIPSSSDWVSQGIEYVIRIAVNSATQLVYLYITPAEDIDNGAPPVLRGIFVAKETQANVSDACLVSAHGVSGGVESSIELFDYKVSTKFLAQNLAPLADAGDDQAVRACSVTRLDGTGSFDPEGNELTYEWRMTDAPQGSMFLVEAFDATTIPEAPATGFTARLFSDTLAEAHDVEPIVAGDVLTTPDGSFTVIGTGTLLSQFYVDVEYEQIPDNLVAAPVRILRQAGVSGANEAKPTFYPDKLGFYTFDLRVFDGEVSSSPLGLNRSITLINVLETPLPKGCAVDAEFVFDYMLSFWKLVEDRDRISTFFESVSRVAATELFTLWQYEYSKSLRDVQRTLNRRWLHYDPLLPEPLPELTTVRTLWGGASSDVLTQPLSAVAGSKMVVSSPRLADPIEVPFSSTGLVDVERYAREIQIQLEALVDPSFRTTVDYQRPSLTATTDLPAIPFPAGVTGLTLGVTIDGGALETVVIGLPVNLQEFVAELVAGLPSAVVSLETDGLRIGSATAGQTSSVVIDPTSTLLDTNAGPLVFPALAAALSKRILITAEVPFTLTTLSNAPGFTYPLVNSLVGGLSGQKVADKTFRADVPMLGYGLQEDDLLVIGAETYRVAQVLDSSLDPYVNQRVLLKDSLSSDLDAPDTVLPAPAVEWVIPGWVQSEFLNFYSGLVDRGDFVDFEAISTDGDQETTDLVETVAIGVSSLLPTRLAVDTARLASVTTGEEIAVRLARVLRRHYRPISSLIVDVPILTDVISVEDPDTVLQQNLDYFVEDFRGQHCLRFSAAFPGDLGDVWEGLRPPDRLWAEYTFVDNEQLIEDNFGAPIGLTRDVVPDTVDYLSAVRGVWYALYNGPTVRNLRISVQIFLGLPFAEVSGTIVELRTDFFSQQSRMLIQDTDNPEIVRSYVYPRILDTEVNPETGLPYVIGDSVTQFAPLVTGALVTDYIKDPTWFSGLLTQGIFTEVQKYHSFLVRVDANAFNLNSLLFAQDFVKSVKPVYTDPLYVVLFRTSGDGDEIDVVDQMIMRLTLRFTDQPCAGRFGSDNKYDQPWPGGQPYGELWRNEFDSNSDPDDADPVYPGPPDTVQWGWDKEYLCPTDDVFIEACEEYVNEPPHYDGVLKYDIGPVRQIMNTEAGPLAFPYTFALGNAAEDATLTRVFLRLNGPTGPIDVEDWEIEVLIDGGVEATLPLTLGRQEYQEVLGVPTLVFVITIPQNVDVHRTVSVAVLTGQSIALRLAPLGGAQNPGWTSFDVAVSYEDGIWQFDEPLLNGTVCGYNYGDPP